MKEIIILKETAAIEVFCEKEGTFIPEDSQEDFFTEETVATEEATLLYDDDDIFDKETPSNLETNKIVWSSDIYPNSPANIKNVIERDEADYQTSQAFIVPKFELDDHDDEPMTGNIPNMLKKAIKLERLSTPENVMLCTSPLNSENRCNVVVPSPQNTRRISVQSPQNTCIIAAPSPQDTCDRSGVAQSPLKPFPEQIESHEKCLMISDVCSLAENYHEELSYLEQQRVQLQSDEAKLLTMTLDENTSFQSFKIQKSKTDSLRKYIKCLELEEITGASRDMVNPFKPILLSAESSDKILENYEIENQKVLASFKNLREESFNLLWENKELIWENKEKFTHSDIVAFKEKEIALLDLDRRLNSSQIEMNAVVENLPNEIKSFFDSMLNYVTEYIYHIRNIFSANQALNKRMINREVVDLTGLKEKELIAKNCFVSFEKPLSLCLKLKQLPASTRSPLKKSIDSQRTMLTTQQKTDSMIASTSHTNVAQSTLASNSISATVNKCGNHAVVPINTTPVIVQQRSNEPSQMMSSITTGQNNIKTILSHLKANPVLHNDSSLLPNNRTELGITINQSNIPSASNLPEAKQHNVNPLQLNNASNNEIEASTIVKDRRCHNPIVLEDQINQSSLTPSTSTTNVSANYHLSQPFATNITSKIALPFSTDSDINIVQRIFDLLVTLLKSNASCGGTELLWQELMKHFREISENKNFPFVESNCVPPKKCLGENLKLFRVSVFFYHIMCKKPLIDSTLTESCVRRVWYIITENYSKRCEEKKKLQSQKSQTIITPPPILTPASQHSSKNAANVNQTRTASFYFKKPLPELNSGRLFSDRNTPPRNNQSQVMAVKPIQHIKPQVAASTQPIEVRRVNTQFNSRKKHLTTSPIILGHNHNSRVTTPNVLSQRPILNAPSRFIPNAPPRNLLNPPSPLLNSPSPLLITPSPLLNIPPQAGFFNPSVQPNHSTSHSPFNNPSHFGVQSDHSFPTRSTNFITSYPRVLTPQTHAPNVSHQTSPSPNFITSYDPAIVSHQPAIPTLQNNYNNVPSTFHYFPSEISYIGCYYPNNSIPPNGYSQAPGLQSYNAFQTGRVQTPFGQNTTGQAQVEIQTNTSHVHLQNITSQVHLQNTTSPVQPQTTIVQVKPQAPTDHLQPQTSSAQLQMQPNANSC